MAVTHEPGPLDETPGIKSLIDFIDKVLPKQVSVAQPSRLAFQAKSLGYIRLAKVENLF